MREHARSGSADPGSDERLESDLDTLREPDSEETEAVRRLLARVAEDPEKLDSRSFAELLGRLYGEAADDQEVASEGSDDEIVGRATSARYRISEELGRGGMGRVLRAWNLDLRRDLAMKVLLPRNGEGGSTHVRPDPTVIGRFLDEARITGQLDHPGIVPVHELGIDTRGRVYFTMRLVKGRDLRRIFDLVRDRAEGWTVTRALGALLKVCEAMAYAHSKGVIHRDLKPSNIMIGRFGEVYVMDWGLARVLGDEHVEEQPDTSSDTSKIRPVRGAHGGSDDLDDPSPLLTHDGDVVGTPVYMSPEQARGEHRLLGPTSDVYSLGSILYHLLAGRGPYVPEKGLLDPRQVLRTVQLQAPTPLSQIAPEVPAELRAICEKAMAREPGGRYGDMGELAEDLRAYLEHRVVRAHEAGRRAKLRKWVRRNRALTISIAAALALVSVSLLIGLIAARREAARAQQAADTANRVSGFVVDLYRSFDPSVGGREVMEVKADALIESLRGEPAQLTVLLGELAGVWEGFHFFERPVRWRGEALDLTRARAPDNGPAATDALFHLALALHGAGRYAEAESSLERALADHRASGGSPRVEAGMIHALARARWRLGERDGPLASIEESLALYRAEGTDPSAEELRTALDLGSFLAEQGELARAESALRDALAQVDPEWPDSHNLEADAWQRLAAVLWETPRFRESEAHLRRAIRLLNAAPDHDRLLFATCLLDLATHARGRGAGELARELSTRSIRHFESLLESRSVDLATSLGRAVEFLTSDSSRAQSLRAIEILESRLPGDHPQLASLRMTAAMNTLYRVKHQMAVNEEDIPRMRANGLELARNAFQVLAASYPEDHWRRGDVERRFGRALAFADLATEADAHLEIARELLLASHGPRHPRTREALWALRENCVFAGDLARAAEYESHPSYRLAWPYYDHVRDDDGQPDSHASIDYDDDFVEKTLVVPAVSAGITTARAWFYALPFNYPGESFRPVQDYNVQVNDRADQVISFAIDETFDCLLDPERTQERLADAPLVPGRTESFDGYRWNYVEFPVSWLVEGENVLRLYETPIQDHMDPPLEWYSNNLRIGIDTSSDFQRSWWCANLELSTGVAMARLIESERAGTVPTPAELVAARRTAQEACEGELMIFLELCGDPRGGAPTRTK